MKRIVLIVCSLCLWAAFSVAGRASEGQSVEMWDVFEVSLPAQVKGNPFDVSLSAVFKNGDASVKVNGFYDGDGVFKLRFMPDREGSWTYTTSSSFSALNRKKGSFVCSAPSEGNHGPVEADGLHFKYADGTRYYPVGTTSYDWMHVPGDYPERTVASLEKSGFNKIRMLFFLHNLDVDYPEVYPFEKNSDGSWNYEKFDPAYFKYVEERILSLRKIGVEADLILFHPYDGGRWGFDRMPLEVNLRYLKYICARFSAFRNLWWSLANEFDGVKGIPEEDWAKFAACVRENDPYGHLLSIHGYTATYYDYSAPEFSHASIQDHAPVMQQGTAATVRNIYGKPVIFDEVCYEGNAGSRWGELCGEEELRRMYNGLMAGVYVTHAECLNLSGDGSGKEEKTNFLAFGGEFHGESWKRIRFMRNILDDLPEPLYLSDKSWDFKTSAAGEGYYLVYFGLDMPSEWEFNLPVKNTGRPNLGEGRKFSVEILDTWNMTVTPCEGVFETGKPGRYRIGDKNGRIVKLPQRPYIMLRIKEI